MQQLILRRDRMIRDGHNIIRNANRNFDAEAVPLGKEINRLREQERASKPATITSKQQSKRSSVSYAGLTDEEIEHVKRLQEGAG